MGVVRQGRGPGGCHSPPRQAQIRPCMLRRVPRDLHVAQVAADDGDVFWGAGTGDVSDGGETERPETALPTCQSGRPGRVFPSVNSAFQSGPGGGISGPQPSPLPPPTCAWSDPESGYPASAPPLTSLRPPGTPPAPSPLTRALLDLELQQEDDGNGRGGAGHGSDRAPSTDGTKLPAG